MEFSQSAMLAANMHEYQDDYQRLNFITEEEGRAATLLRSELLEKLVATGASSICQGTKLHTGELSPGCRSCTNGRWSCLFINGLCNGRCFYCPTTQDSKSEPTTNNLRFANPQDYIDYVQLFDFTGVSISGGEPLMTYDRTLTYVTKLKKRFGNAIHLWMYTNGMLATEEKIRSLADAGLDEIRFDISADRYVLDKIKFATGRIPWITVEIPAIPEDYQQLRALLPALADAGVNHLNLHQLRCTPHNLNNLTARNYRFSHGPRILSIDSELTALRLLFDAATGRAPAVNYCSYAYKYRFQSRASRLRVAARLADPCEDITEAGFIRRLTLTGSAKQISECTAQINRKGITSGLQLENPGRLNFNISLWPHLDFTGCTLLVSYYTPQLRENASYRGRTLKVPLNRKRTLIAERIGTVNGREIPPEERLLFKTLFLTENHLLIQGEHPELLGTLADIYELERLPDGLHLYQ
ncbi:MAG: radical SAM protein [Proteobacteria bacterium]|nr:radical SAM protein [Pseudomonadota bacterium]MBU1687356.1 radical SAM protein [Pseudomonadota bacterium]